MKEHLVEEASKSENEADIRKLRREMQQTKPITYRDARMGRNHGINDSYYVVGIGDDGQQVTIAEFPFDNFDEGKRRDTARIMAEELVDKINDK